MLRMLIYSIHVHSPPKKKKKKKKKSWKAIYEHYKMTVFFCLLLAFTRAMKEQTSSV